MFKLQLNECDTPRITSPGRGPYQSTSGGYDEADEKILMDLVPMWLDCDIWRFLSVMVIKRLSTHFNTPLLWFKVHIKPKLKIRARPSRPNLNVNLWYVFRPRWELAVSLSRVCNEPVYQVKSPTENLRPSVLPRPTQSGQYRTFVIATFSFFHLRISWKLSKGWTHRPGPISWPTCSLSSSSQGETARNWSNNFFSPNHHDLNTI